MKPIFVISNLYYNYISQSSVPCFGWLPQSRSTAHVTQGLHQLALCDLSITSLVITSANSEA
jgi:hypothetical protein